MNSKDILNDKRNFIFIGESGCGKTELSLNLSKRIASMKKNIHEEVNLFDMDQTKTIFRSRDFKSCLSKYNINIFHGESFLDMPVIPNGVIEKLKDENSINILDIGGNIIGVRTLGQFEQIINKSNSIIFFIINPYRSFSNNSENIRITLENLKASGRINNIEIIINPNLGRDTTKNIVIQGINVTNNFLKKLDLKSNIVTIPNWIDINDLSLPASEIFRIEPYINYP